MIEVIVYMILLICIVLLVFVLFVIIMSCFDKVIELLENFRGKHNERS